MNTQYAVGYYCRLPIPEVTDYVQVCGCAFRVRTNWDTFAMAQSRLALPGDLIVVKRADTIHICQRPGWAFSSYSQRCIEEERLHLTHTTPD